MNIGYDTPFWNRRPPDWDEVDIEKPAATAQDFLELSCFIDFTDAQIQEYWNDNTEEGDAAADAFILRNIERIFSEWRKHLRKDSLEAMLEFERDFDVDFDVLKEVYAI